MQGASGDPSRVAAPAKIRDRQPFVVMNHSQQILEKVPEWLSGAFSNHQLHSFLATYTPTLYLTPKTKCSFPGIFISDCYLGNGDYIVKTKMLFTSRSTSHPRTHKTSCLGNTKQAGVKTRKHIQL